jgi:hypothetical protein
MNYAAGGRRLSSSRITRSIIEPHSQKTKFSEKGDKTRHSIMAWRLASQARPRYFFSPILC